MLPMPAPSRQTGVSDVPLYFLSARRIPRFRARVTFGRSGPLHRLSLCLRRPHFFQQRKKYGKERRQKPMVFGFPFRPIVTAVQKGSAPNRLHSYPRCRSCVPRENFLLSRRTGEVLYILHTFIFCGPKGRTYAAVGKSGSLRRAKCPRARGRGTLSCRCWKKWGRRRQG